MSQAVVHNGIVYLAGQVGKPGDNVTEMNAVWDAWVPQGHTPARAAGEAKLATPDYLVEFIVTAAQK
jgi:enamine deaminase RidA (YjgF/YER057c/UK114 family)